ncbi:alpha-galactosidase-like protein, partial [Trifolium pratense]
RWNSWNHFQCDITEDLIKETADAMVSTGLADLGYQYINLDDCWGELNRDSKTPHLDQFALKTNSCMPVEFKTPIRLNECMFSHKMWVLKQLENPIQYVVQEAKRRLVCVVNDGGKTKSRNRLNVLILFSNKSLKNWTS